MHLTIEDGGIRILELVEMQYVGMNQVYAGILYLCLPCRALLLLLFLGKTGDHPYQQGHHHQKYEGFSTMHLSIINCQLHIHFIHPSYSK